MNTQGLNRCAQHYLDEYDCILRDMIEGMTNAELTRSISRNFIVQMIPHHRAAIQMSRNILRYTQDQRLRDIAQSIIREQTRSIENMQAIKQHCGRHINSCAALRNYRCANDRILGTMFRDMRNAPAGCNISCDFIMEMIPHHMGAIRMSENTLRYGICRGLRPIIRSIIVSQKRGVCQLQTLAECLNCNN